MNPKQDLDHDNNSGGERPIRPTEQPQQSEDSLTVQQFDKEKQTEEGRQAYNAASKRRHSYVLAVLVLIVLAGTGAGYYAYRQYQERLATEQRAAKERSIARAKKAQEEREAQELWAKRQITTEANKRTAAKRQKQEVQKILSNKEYRRSVGAYIVGEYHEGLGGIVFYVDNTYKHGKVISVSRTGNNKDQRYTWEQTSERIKSLGGKWRLPTIQEWELIYKQFFKKNIKTDFPLGLKQGKTFYETAYWSSTKWRNDNTCNWTFRFDRGIKDGCYHSYNLYVRAVASF